MARIRPVVLLSLPTALFAVFAAAGAQATTGTGHQNPNLAVSVSLTPGTATNGDVVTATETVTNTSSVKRTVAITGTLTTPDGRTLARSTTMVLKPGQTFSDGQTYTASPSDPRGSYTLRLDATARGGTSSASGTVTLI